MVESIKTASEMHEQFMTDNDWIYVTAFFRSNVKIISDYSANSIVKFEF